MNEETGITIEILFGFKYEISYFYKKEGKLSHKTVVFFIGVTEQEKVKLSFEHDGFEWLNYEDAIKRLTFENEKKALMRAKEFLESIKLT